MCNILLLHAGVSNKGSLALVLSTVETVQTYMPNAEFTFMGVESDQKIIPIRKQLAFKPLKNLSPWIYLFRCVFYSLSRKLGFNSTISPNSELYPYYQADLVLNSGGDQLSGEKFGFSTLLNISYAILLGKPVVLYAESLGYYQNSLFDFIAKTVFKHTKLITVREELSKKYLDKLKFKDTKVYVTADSAFNLSPISREEALNILENENIENINKPLVGINASGLISRYRKANSNSSDQEIIDIFANVVDSIVKKFDATVILVPHVYTENVSDVKTINAIYDKVSETERVFKITNEYSAMELKGIIGLCDMFIGARMHSTIASTSMLVPTVGIAYSHKMHGVIGQMVGLEPYIIDVNDLTSDIMMKKIESVWNSRENIHKELSIKIPVIKEKAFLNGKYVKELCDSL